MKLIDIIKDINSKMKIEDRLTEGEVRKLIKEAIPDVSTQYFVGVKHIFVSNAIYDIKARRKRVERLEQYWTSSSTELVYTSLEVVWHDTKCKDYTVVEFTEELNTRSTEIEQHNLAICKNNLNAFNDYLSECGINNTQYNKMSDLYSKLSCNDRHAIDKAKEH
jgi:hypothetical protein